MVSYFIVFICTLFIQLFHFNSKNGYLLKLLISFLPLFIYGAIRVDYGLDYEAYQEEFFLLHKYGNAYISEHSEIGYVILNKLLPSFRHLLVLQSALLYSCYVFFFYKFIPEKYGWLAVCLLFLCGHNTVFFMFSGIRNSIALLFFIFGFIFIAKRSFVYYFLLCALATSFHTSALIIFPLVYFVVRPTQMNRIELCIWISVLLILIILPFDTLFNNTSFIVTRYFDRYTYYLDRVEEFDDRKTILIIASSTFFTLSNLFFLYNNQLSKNENVIGRLALIGMLVPLLGSINLRFSFYFIIPFICSTIYFFDRMRMQYKAFTRLTIQIIRYLYLCMFLIYQGYAFFVVFLGRENFPYSEYHSLLD